jgi:hypothetical protein
LFIKVCAAIGRIEACASLLFSRKQQKSELQILFICQGYEQEQTIHAHISVAQSPLAMNTMEQEEPPPPYSPGPDPDVSFFCGQEAHQSIQQRHDPDANHTFDCIEKHIANARHSDEICRYGSNRFSVKRSSSAPGASAELLEGDIIGISGQSHISLYAHSRRVATLRFRSDYGELHFGPAYNPAAEQWTPIELTRGHLLHPTSYEFRGGTKRLAWKHHHGPHVFGGAGNWVLEDLAAVGSAAPRHREHQSIPKVIVGGHSIAAFHQRPGSWVHGRSPEYTVGEVRWKDEHGDEVEYLALLTLVFILQQS